VAEELKKLPNVDVRLEDGKQGELTVLVDGRVVAEKKTDLPSADQVVAAVRAAA
jgi:hypothetical protein